MHASQICSYYPKYSYLDSVLSLTGKNKLNLYIDLKGCMQALFQEWAVRYIIANSQDSNMMDTCIFASALEFISFHKQYAKKRNIDLNMYIFFEQGKSSYHKNIYSEYKSQRGIGDFFGLDDAKRELFYKVFNQNLVVIDKVCNKIPNVSVLRLEFLEADFIPWYLMNRVLDISDSANIIYSTDKDMLQCLMASNIFQYYRHYKSVKMLSYKDVFSHFLKEDLDLSAEWFCIVLAILGDAGDGFSGVRGIGNKRLTKILSQVISLCGSMQEVYENIEKKQSIFKQGYDVSDKNLRKVIENEEIIVRNLKLLSFRMLSDYIDGGYPLDTIERKRYINKCVAGDIKISNATVLFNALEKSGLTGLVTESTISNLFQK